MEEDMNKININTETGGPEKYRLRVDVTVCGDSREDAADSIAEAAGDHADEIAGMLEKVEDLKTPGYDEKVEVAASELRRCTTELADRIEDRNIGAGGMPGLEAEIKAYEKAISIVDGELLRMRAFLDNLKARFETKE